MVRSDIAAARRQPAGDRSSPNGARPTHRGLKSRGYDSGKAEATVGTKSDPAAVRSAVESFVTDTGVRRVAFAGGRLPPPQLAYLVNFPRLSVVLSGKERIEYESPGELKTLIAKRGDALFVPANSWNRPTPVGVATVLTVLFGKRQTGLSLVRTTPAGESAIKAHIHRPLHGPLPGILDALNHLAADNTTCPSARPLVDAALHACVSLLDEPATEPGRKGARTFHNICLYLQESFQFPLTRDSVADHFGFVVRTTSATVPPRRADEFQRLPDVGANRPG